MQWVSVSVGFAWSCLFLVRNLYPVLSRADAQTSRLLLIGIIACHAGLAIAVTGTAAVLPVAILAARGASGLDVYGWMGSLATYGFIVTYALVSVALPRYLRAHNAYRPGAQIIPWLACAAMLLALVGNLYPVPEGPYGKLPYIYLVYLIAGLSWFFWCARKTPTAPNTL